MKIGITERGDAGIDLSWVEKINEMDGAILISKNFNPVFQYTVLNCQKPLILHCTCTGYGHTELEPCVPDYVTQLGYLKNIIKNGFPAANCVLRIDPIFPSTKGLMKVEEVLKYFQSLDTGVSRIRVSLVDEYKHVKERYREHGWLPLYGNNFNPSQNQICAAAHVLNKYGFVYETCAEEGLASFLNRVKVIGCVSKFDLDLMNLTYDEETINPQNRKGCKCLACKTELLTRKEPCQHGCVYCYWKEKENKKV